MRDNRRRIAGLISMATILYQADWIWANGGGLRPAGAVSGGRPAARRLVAAHAAQRPEAGRGGLAATGLEMGW